MSGALGNNTTIEPIEESWAPSRRHSQPWHKQARRSLTHRHARLPTQIGSSRWPAYQCTRYDNTDISTKYRMTDLRPVTPATSSELSVARDLGAARPNRWLWSASATFTDFRLVTTRAPSRPSPGARLRHRLRQRPVRSPPRMRLPATTAVELAPDIEESANVARPTLAGRPRPAHRPHQPHRRAERRHVRHPGPYCMVAGPSDVANEVNYAAIVMG